MKKYIFPAFLSVIIGVSLSFLIIKSYDNTSLITVSANTKKVYFIQSGVYSDKQNMINSMTDFENYIYSVENNLYHTFIGMTKSQNNANKIKEKYKQEGITTYIVEKNITNSDFITILKQYDDVLTKTDDTKTIKVIENQVLANYKEYIQK